MACCRSPKARSSSRGLTREAERRDRFGMASPDSCLVAKLRVRKKRCVREVLHAQLPENMRAAERGTADEETCAGPARCGCGGQEQRAGFRGETGDLAEVRFQDAGAERRLSGVSSGREASCWRSALPAAGRRYEHAGTEAHTCQTPPPAPEPPVEHAESLSEATPHEFEPPVLRHCLVQP